MAEITKINDQTEQIEYNDPSPQGMFRIGWLAAQRYKEANVTINHSMRIQVAVDPDNDKVDNTIDLRPAKGRKSCNGAPITITATLKDSVETLPDCGENIEHKEERRGNTTSYT